MVWVFRCTVELACGKLDEVNRGGRAVLPRPLSPGLCGLQSETFSVSEASLFCTSSPANAGRLGAGVPAARQCFGKHEICFIGRSNEHNHLLFLFSGGYCEGPAAAVNNTKGKAYLFSASDIGFMYWRDY